MILLAGVEAANRWLLPPAHPVRDPPAESPVSGLPVPLATQDPALLGHF